MTDTSIDTCGICRVPGLTPRIARQNARPGERVSVTHRRTRQIESGTIVGWGPSRLRIRTADGRTVDYPATTHCVHTLEV